MCYNPAADDQQEATSFQSSEVMSWVISLPRTPYSVQIRLRVCDSIFQKGARPFPWSSCQGRFRFFPPSLCPKLPGSNQKIQRKPEKKKECGRRVSSTEHECPTRRSCGGRRESDARGLIFRFIVDAQLDGRHSNSFPSLLDATCWKAPRRHLLPESTEEGRRVKK